MKPEVVKYKRNPVFLIGTDADKFENIEFFNGYRGFQKPVFAKYSVEGTFVVFYASADTAEEVLNTLKHPDNKKLVIITF
jgi:hypothetical protein